VLVGPFVFAAIDLCLLLMYPWATPTDAEFLGTVERLSPIVETFLEGFAQSSFQLYMWLRCQFLEDHEVEDGLERVLFLSFLPSLFRIAKKLYDLHSDGKDVGMRIDRYTLELFKGPLGLSAPFVTLLTKREAVHYDGLGQLSRQQQQDVFGALGPENAKLEELTFDGENGVDLAELCRHAAPNRTLQLVAVGGETLLSRASKFRMPRVLALDR
jgi:hypothetical protein